MYRRSIDGELYTFGVSGKLIMNVLVMYDHQTNTLWSQFLSKGVEGPLEGVDLDVLPATQTTWAAWRELHPDTKVLNKDGKYLSDAYARYYDNDSAGVRGESNIDSRLETKQLVVGVQVNGKPKAYPFSALRQRDGVVNDTLSDEDVLVFFDSGSDTALVFNRNVNGKVLTFRLEGGAAGVQTVLVDDETGSRWSAFTGRALDGELKGSTLQRIPSHLSFWFAWTDWNPDTELYTG